MEACMNSYLKNDEMQKFRESLPSRTCHGVSINLFESVIQGIRINIVAEDLLYNAMREITRHPKAICLNDLEIVWEKL